MQLLLLVADEIPWRLVKMAFSKRPIKMVVLMSATMKSGSLAVSTTGFSFNSSVFASIEENCLIKGFLRLL